MSSATLASYRKGRSAAQESDQRVILIEQRVRMHSEPEAFGFGHVDTPVPPRGSGLESIYEIAHRVKWTKVRPPHNPAWLPIRGP